jgi:hypothetical protein
MYDVMSRADYVAWCKQRALAEPEPANMLASMLSDLRERPDTNGDHLGFLLLAGANHIHDPAAMRHFIEGFN